MQNIAMTDENLKKAVLDELNWEPSVKAAHVGVTARGGIVTLTGHVESYAEKWAVERAASRLSGVKAVAEELEVRWASSAPAQGDEDIAKRAANILAWDVFVPVDKVKVKVEKGWVTLTGNVDWYYQRTNAEQNVRNLHGVTGVSNNITIKPAVKAADIKLKIDAAFGRSAQIDADGITVTTDGGKVTLTGNVDSFYERSLAQSTAWSAPGVTNVDDRLLVN